MSIACRVDAENFVSVSVHYRIAKQSVVVSEEYCINAFYAFSNMSDGILFIFFQCQPSFPAGMEKSDDDICVFFVFYKLNIFPGALLYRQKAHALPKLFVQPVRNSRCCHTDYGYPHSFSFDDSIWFKVRSACSGTDDIGCKEWGVKFFVEFVVDQMTCFYVVVSYCYAVILHIVIYGSSKIGLFRIDEVGEIECRLPLQNVTRVNEQEVPAESLAS